MLPDNPRQSGDPLSFSTLWQETVSVLKQHGAVLWPLGAAFLLLPQLFLGFAVADLQPSMAGAGKVGPVDAGGRGHLLLAVLPVLLLTLWGNLVIAFIAVRNGTNGQSLGQVIQMATKRLGTAIAAAGLLSVAMLLIGLLMMILFAVLLGPSSGTRIGLVVALVPVAFLAARFSLIVPVIATTDATAVEALERSWRITNGLLSRILGYYGVFLVGALLISLGVNSIGMALQVFGRLLSLERVGTFLTEVGNSAGAAFVGLVSVVFMARFFKKLQQMDGQKN